MRYSIDSNGSEKEITARYYINKNGNEKETSGYYIDGDGNEHQIWGSGRAIYLGLSTSFDVKNYYKNYGSLTVDDFFVTPREGNLVVTGYHADPGDCNDFGDSISFSKSYNRTTGIFSCSYAGSVYAWVIPNSNKLIEKGKIIDLGTFRGNKDIKLIYKNYAKLNKNNFLVRSYAYVASNYICCSNYCDNSCGTEKGYSNGVFYGQTTQRRNHSDYNRNDPPRPTHWYLITEKVLK